MNQAPTTPPSDKPKGSIPPGSGKNMVLIGVAFAIATQIPTTLGEIKDATVRALIQILAVVIVLYIGVKVKI